MMAPPDLLRLALAAISLALPVYLDAQMWIGQSPWSTATREMSLGLLVPPEYLPVASAQQVQALLSPARSSAFGCKCGFPPSSVIDTRIVGGVPAPQHAFPWMVAILLDGYMNCGGSIINDRYVLTAGHCLAGLSPRNITVMAGVNDLLSSDRILLPAHSLIIHEDFNRDYLHDIDDIALIRLASAIPFSDKVAPVCLPQTVSTNYGGEMSIVAGWGRIGQDKPLSRFLLATEVRVVSQDTCRKSAIGDHITDKMLCTYYDNKDACQGDSGGPLVYISNDGHFEQIGVVSWGIGCARPSMPGVFTRVTKYMNWIQQKTRDAYYCPRN